MKGSRNSQNPQKRTSQEQENATCAPDDATQIDTETSDANVITHTVAPGKTSTRGELSQGEMFAHYRIERQLGRGGMGVVYRALDTKLGRIVALKLILPVSDTSGRQAKRFLQEARATARLTHPNIVRLFEVGEQPQNYFSMEYIEGKTLSDLKYSGEVKHRQAAEILQKVAFALHTAHEQGIIHRDIKPSNIMIDKEGQPKVMDFGLAKITDTRASLSKTGDLLGTPSYMSPEQANGKNVDQRTDIYSMGAALYDMLTGRPPFQGESYFNILHQIHCVEALAPRKLNPDIPAELEAICLKSLEKSAVKRYQSAYEFAEDLGNYLENRPVIAKPPTRLTYAMKFIMRNRTLALAVLMVFLTTIIGGVFSLVQWKDAESKRQDALKAQKTAEGKEREAIEARQRAERERKRAESEKQKADAAKKEAIQARAQKEREASAAKLRLGEIAYEKADEAYEDRSWNKCGVLAGATMEFVKGLSDDKACALANKARALVRQAIICEGMVWETRQSKVARQMQIVWGGKMLATVSSAARVEFLDILNGRILRNFTVKRHGWKSAAFSPDGSLLAFGLENGDIELYNPDGGKPVVMSGHLGSVHSLLFSHNGNLASASLDGTVRLWDTRSDKQIQLITIKPGALKAYRDYLHAVKSSVKTIVCRPKRSIMTLAFHPQRSILVVASNDGSIGLWDISTPKVEKPFQKLKVSDSVKLTRFSPDGIVLVSVSGAGKINLWDVVSGKNLVEKDCKVEINDIDFAPGGKILASACDDGTVRLWSLLAKVPAQELPLSISGQYESSDRPNQSYQGQQQQVPLSPSETPKQWNIEETRVFYRHAAPALLVAFSADGNTVISSSKDRVLRMWDARSGQQIERSVKLAKIARVLSTSNDAEKTAAVLSDHFAGVEKEGHIDSDVANVRCLSFTPDGKTTAFGLGDGSVILQTEGQTEKRARGKGEITSLCFSADGKMLAIGSESGSVELHILSGGLSGEFTTSGKVFDVALSPDGRFLAAATEKNVAVWGTGEKKQLFLLEQRKTVSMDFSPTGKCLACASKKTLYLWDIAAKNRFSESPLWGKIHCMRFTPYGRLICCSSSKTSIRLWNGETGKTLSNINTEATVTSACLSPDCKMLACAFDDRTIKFWHVPGRREIAVRPRFLKWMSYPRSSFDFRTDTVAGKLIEVGLSRCPQTTVTALFRRKVTTTLATPPATPEELKFELRTFAFGFIGKKRRKRR